MITTPRNLGHLTKRIRQTPQLFANYPHVFYDLAASMTPWQGKEMSYRLRNGYTIVSPNADGARFPIYEIFADDAYLLDTMLAGLPADVHVMDLGGQIGCFSLAVALKRPQARVHVYEASPTSASYVRRNVGANDLADRITVHAKAMAGEEGTFTFVDSGTASGHNGITAPEGLGHEVTVPSTTFDAAVKEMDGRVEVVKADVEGAEYDIILKSDPASWATVQRVVMEYHPVAGHSLDELLEFFAAVGLHPGEHDRGTRPGLGVIWLSRK
ncbi:FkbM family methyltransferase [Nocardioides daejeonensis]|uniref:FkbM family methyltransferase n=1 Tax=Nocardioides daejeonensis TaxID=1046556 RepID=UPI000D74ECCA|nr:FkbM family methyltransferase [Nocardioides daejeonensis]